MSRNAVLLAVVLFISAGTIVRASRRPTLVMSFARLATNDPNFSERASVPSDLSTLAGSWLRGGSTVANPNDEDEKSPAVNEGEVESANGVEDAAEDEEDAKAEEEKSPTAASSTPARLLIQTNWGNAVVDHRIELTSSRTKDIASVKKRVSKQLPGKPPVLGLELVFEGNVLEDDMLVGELFDGEDEDEDDDDDEDDSNFKVITLNMVPPVDARFAIDLVPKLKSHIEDDEDTMTTEELVDAYFLNQAAMSRNALLLANPDEPSSPLFRAETIEQARRLKEELKSEISSEVWDASMTSQKRDHNTEEIRGQRYRSGKGGARTSLKKSIQTNLNIVSINVSEC